MKSFINHARIYILRGLLAIIPVLLSLLAIRFIYIIIDKRIVEYVDQRIGFKIYGLGIIIVLIILYFIGLIASNVIGKQFFNFIENITSRIPIIKTTYQVGKQVSQSLSMPEKQIFKRVVFVDLPKNGILTAAFVTGSIVNKKNNETLLKVFIPTVPNPTTGFLFFIKESQTISTDWTVEETMKTIISGGIIGPAEIN